MKIIKFEDRLNIWLLAPTIVAAALLKVAMAGLPNIELMTLFTISTALVLGPLSGFIAGFGAMFLSDFMMGLPGPWTLYTALSYGFVGIICGFLGMTKTNWSRKKLLLLSSVMIIFWDTITAAFYSVNFMVPIQAAFLAQIPFTQLHLISALLVPLFAPYLMKFYSETKDFSVLKLLKYNLTRK